MDSKLSWIADTEYDQSGNSSSSIHVGPDIWNLVFLYDFILFLHV